MEIHQIVVRVPANSVIALYDDGAGNRNSLVFDSSGIAAVANLVAECQRRLPSPDQNPSKGVIELQIVELTERLNQLKQAVGQPV